MIFQASGRGFSRDTPTSRCLIDRCLPCFRSIPCHDLRNPDFFRDAVSHESRNNNNSLFSVSVAFPAYCSWYMPRDSLTRTMENMIAASFSSPNERYFSPAMRSSITREFRKGKMNSTNAVRLFFHVSSFRPDDSRQSSASEIDFEVPSLAIAP